MAIRRGGKYYCPVCNLEFPNAMLADTHRDAEHDIVYVPMERKDIGRLIQFLYSGEKELISPNLVAMLKQVMKNSTKNMKIDEI